MRPRQTGAFKERQPPPGLKIFNLEVSRAGGWQSFNDLITYQTHGESFSPQSVQWRRQEATSPYLGGKYLVHAVPDQVTENITIWVMGSDQFELQENIYTLVEAFTQFSFQIRRTFDYAGEIWDCYPADYSIDYGPVYVHNRKVPVKLQVPRLPAVVSEPNA